MNIEFNGTFNEEKFKDYNISKIPCEQLFVMMTPGIKRALEKMTKKEKITYVTLKTEECRKVAMFDEYLQIFMPITQLIVTLDDKKYMFSFSPFRAFALQCGGKVQLSDIDAEKLTDYTAETFSTLYGEKYEKDYKDYNYIVDKEDARDLHQ